MRWRAIHQAFAGTVSVAFGCRPTTRNCRTSCTAEGEKQRENIGCGFAQDPAKNGLFLINKQQQHKLHLPKCRTICTGILMSHDASATGIKCLHLQNVVTVRVLRSYRLRGLRQAAQGARTCAVVCTRTVQMSGVQGWARMGRAGGARARELTILAPALRPAGRSEAPGGSRSSCLGSERAAPVAAYQAPPRRYYPPPPPLHPARQELPGQEVPGPGPRGGRGEGVLSRLRVPSHAGRHRGRTGVRILRPRTGRSGTPVCRAPRVRWNLREVRPCERCLLHV